MMPTEQADRLMASLARNPHMLEEEPGQDLLAVLKALTALQARVGELEAVEAALVKIAYVMSEPHLSGHRVVIGFDDGDDAYAAHKAVAEAAKAAARPAPHSDGER